MRKFWILIIVGLCTISLQAQQEAQYTQFMYNNLKINPGFTGARRLASISTLYRNQWIGFKGNPRSYLVGFDMPFPKSPKLGVGFVISSQSEGVMSRTSFTPSVSYAIIHTEKSTLRVGLNTTYRQYRFDLTSNNVYIRNRQDPTLSTEAQPVIKNMNVGFGVYLDNRNFYAGISIPNLNENPLIISPDNGVEIAGKEYRHVYISMGGVVPLSKNVDFKPALMFKYVKNAPFSADANLSLLFNKKFMGGVSYRLNNGNGDSADLLGFIQINSNLGIGAAYDYALSQIGNYSRSSFEMLARYDISMSPKTLHNPRFFF